MSLPLFEGPEKKLELLLTPHQDSLRDIPEGFWDEVLQICGATIVTKMSNEYFDSYVLSESSLFVYDRRITLITCGQTKLYKVMPMLLEYFGKENLAYLFYGRKSLSFPEEQESDFEQEVFEVDQQLKGRSYRMGAANGDHVHIYVAKGNKAQLDSDDYTLELLMMNPCKEQLSNYIDLNENDCSEQLRKNSGLEALYQDLNPEYDDHLFVPCGYSLNASMGASYFTIHVTPQEKSSYVSFETNHYEEDWGSRVNTLLNLFKPKKAILVIYSTHALLDIAIGNDALECDEHAEISVLGYTVKMVHMSLNSASK